MFIRSMFPALIRSIKFTTCTFHVHHSTKLENKQHLAPNILDSSILFFDVLLTVHLSIFISVFNQLDTQNFVSQ